MDELDEAGLREAEATFGATGNLASAILAYLRAASKDAEPVAWTSPGNLDGLNDHDSLVIGSMCNRQGDGWTVPLYLTAIEPVAASPGVPDGWKPTAKLEWENVDNTSQWAALPDFWMCYRISLRTDGMKVLRLEWLGNRTDELGVFPEWDDARAAANSDLAFRAEPLARFVPASASEDVLALLQRPDVYHALEIGRMGRPYSDVQGYLYMAEQYRGHSSAYAAQFTDYGLAHAACVLFNVADDLLRALSSKQRSEKE